MVVPVYTIALRISRDFIVKFTSRDYLNESRDVVLNFINTRG
jgi:hypothetical protein